MMMMMKSVSSVDQSGQQRKGFNFKLYINNNIVILPYYYCWTIS